MKRKLIDFDVFRRIENDSLSAAQAELREAAPVLAQAINKDALALHCFGESDVTYETLDGTFVHAGYKIANNNIFFDHIEELVIDTESSRKEARSILSAMMESLLEDKDHKATEAFNKYMNLPGTRRKFIEGKEPKADKKKKKPFAFATAKVKTRFKNDKHVVKAAKKVVKEWAGLTTNVLNYVSLQEFGPTIRESELKHDDRGQVTALRIPTSQARTEGKILSLTYKNMLDTELKILRGKMKSVQEDTAFCRAMADLRKCNALSDSNALEEVLEAVVAKWPDLLYLTQGELAKAIASALDTVGESNHDDQTCEFMAEGILRTAATAFPDRVNKIAHLGGVELDKNNTYESFQNVAGRFYLTLDESSRLEMQIFVDLYNALVEVHQVASAEGNETLKGEAHNLLTDLHGIVNQEAKPDLSLAAEAATWLRALVETNLDDKPWDVSNAPHHTVSGDHPQMAKNASKGYTPSSDFSGDWKSEAPVSDGKNYKGGLDDEMRNRAWGNWSDSNTWPALENPYTPKPFGDYKMKEKSAVDDGDSDWSRFQSKDTWPNLQNPYIPADKEPEMKSDNLVTDK